MTDRHDVSDTVQELGREIAPNQVAVKLNELLSPYGLVIHQGFGDDYGYYIEKKEE